MIRCKSWNIGLLGLAAVIFVGFATPLDAATVAYYRFEEGFPTDAVDDETGDVHGFMDGVTQSDDVPRPTVNGVPNDFSAKFIDAAAIRFDGSTFILHDELSGGSVEATLEFYIKPAEQGHNVIFWTVDAGGDANRYNISINNGAVINVDYRQEDGTIFNLPSIQAEVDIWRHIAITRTLNGDGVSHDYEYFVDREFVGGGTDPVALPPTAFTWTISGRQGCCSNGNYLLDEIRFSDEVLEPADFLEPADPRDPEICDNDVDDDGDGDIDCDDFGCFASCNPEICDDNEDNDGDGDIDCADVVDCATADNCIIEAVESWYRFEEGEGIDIVESETDDVAGVTDALWSTDVPLETVGGEANEFSMEFSAGSSVRIGVGFPFILHSPTVGGSGDATLEWYMKPRDQGHNGLFWTIDGGGDANRYNIHMQSAGLGADFREEGGDLHGVLAGMMVMDLDIWSHVAVVRTDLGDGTHNYDWYLEGVFNNSAVASANVPVAETWTISGRSGCCNAYEGFVDEIHMIGVALDPADFFEPVLEKVIDEICDNGIDDDDDGDTDCDDAECVNFIPDCVESIEAVQTYYRFEEGSEDCVGLPCEVIDEVSGDLHGVAEFVVYSTDVPLDTVDGNSNEFSVEFPEALAAVRFNQDGLGKPFLLHSPIVGGSFDATLEFYIKAPEQGHNGFFWTIDGGGDANRYNISINAGGSIQADYREESGVIHTGVGGGGTVIPDGVWVHVACVRSDLGDGTHNYDWYVEHELVNNGFDEAPNLPIAETWTMSGRGGCCNAFNGLIDELRMTPEAYDTGDFLEPVGDTVREICDDTVDNDDDGDIDCDDADCATALACTEQCNDGVDNDNDGDIDCEDADCAGSSLCDCDPNPFPTTYYRFEDDLADAVSGAVHGTTDAVFSDDVPVADILGQANNSSISFTGGSSARFDGSTFILHSGCEATLEFFVKPADQGHVGLFWTIDGGGDANRYNIHFQTPGLGADYREEGGNLHNVIDGTIILPFDEWSHVACVRTNAAGGAGGDGGHQYDWYVDGALVNTLIDALPLPPTAATWTISGRGGCCNAFEGLLDEVRMTPSALTPSEFLIGDCTPVQEDCGNGVDDDCDGLVDDADTDDCVGGVGPFIRGDCDGNAQVGGSPTEAIVLLNFAFRGGAAPSCLAACDAEANGSIGVTDALRILRHAFLGIGEPDAPFPNCTTSDLPSDVELGCETPIACP